MENDLTKILSTAKNPKKNSTIVNFQKIELVSSLHVTLNVLFPSTRTLAITSEIKKIKNSYTLSALTEALKFLYISETNKL